MSTHANRSGIRPMPAGGPTNLLTSQDYSLDFAEIVGLANGRDVTVRPVLPLDADKFQAFVRNLSDTSRSNRFLHGLRELPVHLLQRLTQIDYRTHMALVGEVVNDGMSIIIAEARYAVDPEEASAELALAVADDWQGLGLGKALFRRLAQHAAAAGLRRLAGETLASNAPVLHLAREAGFSIMPVPGVAGLFRRARNIADPEAGMPRIGLRENRDGRFRNGFQMAAGWMRAGCLRPGRRLKALEEGNRGKGP